MRHHTGKAGNGWPATKTNDAWSAQFSFCLLEEIVDGFRIQHLGFRIWPERAERAGRVWKSSMPNPKS